MADYAPLICVKKGCQAGILGPRVSTKDAEIDHRRMVPWSGDVGKSLEKSSHSPIVQSHLNWPVIGFVMCTQPSLTSPRFVDRLSEGRAAVQSCRLGTAQGHHI